MEVLVLEGCDTPALEVLWEVTDMSIFDLRVPVTLATRPKTAATGRIGRRGRLILMRDVSKQVAARAASPFYRRPESRLSTQLVPAPLSSKVTAELQLLHGPTYQQRNAKLHKTFGPCCCCFPYCFKDL